MAQKGGKVLGHISFGISDVERSRRFYTEALVT